MTDMEKEAARVASWSVASMLAAILVGGFVIIKVIDRTTK